MDATAKRKVTDSDAKWDTESDPANPGWVVYLVFGERGESFAPCPSHYHDGPDADTAAIVADTIAWEGFEDCRA
jgi:hypothetical protein